MNAHSLATLGTLPAEPSAALTRAPLTIGRFSVRSEIGRGSNGVVYSAHDPVLDREVAIKAIPLSHDTQFRAQVEANFLNEAKAAAGLNHPHIVTVFDAGKSDQLAYIAMERLKGEDLHDYMASGARMGWRQAATLMARVADAVHFAHKRGLIHRDLKPSNIFLLRDGKPKVLDFGVALMNMGDGSDAHRRQLIGTPNYMSPEQALGKRLDARSDVFSLGTILYELLGGQRAFEGKTIEETISQVISDEPMPLASLHKDVPVLLASVVERALAKDPAQRYQTAGEMRNELAAYAGRPAGTAANARPRSRFQRMLMPLYSASETVGLPPMVLVAAVAGIVVMVGAALWTSRDEPAIAASPEAPAAPAQTTPAAQPAPTPVAASTTPAVKTDVAPPTTAPAPNGNEAAPAAAPGGNGNGNRAARTEARRARIEGSAAAPQAPQTEGFIALAIAPWGEVMVNGVAQGVSPPLTRLPLAPGLYTIEIRNSAAPAFVARVEVRPGQTLSLQHRF
jgi:serine/threonine-protein kinase